MVYMQSVSDEPKHGKRLLRRRPTPTARDAIARSSRGATAVGGVPKAVFRTEEAILILRDVPALTFSALPAASSAGDRHPDPPTPVSAHGHAGRLHPPPR